MHKKKVSSSEEIVRLKSHLSQPKSDIAFIRTINISVTYLTCLENLLVSISLCSVGPQTHVRAHEGQLGSHLENIQCCSSSHGSSPV